MGTPRQSPNFQTYGSRVNGFWANFFILSKVKINNQVLKKINSMFKKCIYFVKLSNNTSDTSICHHLNTYSYITTYDAQYYIFITDCIEHLANVARHHWTRTPQLYTYSRLWTILHLLNTFLQVPGHWLAEPHNSPSSMSHNMKAGHSINWLCLATCTFLLVTWFVT